MGNKKTPSTPEPSSSPDRNSDFDDPRLSATTPGPSDFPENPFPDHGPLPQNKEEAVDEESDARNPVTPREFYRATSDPAVHEPYVPKKRVKVRRKNQKSVPEWERGEGVEDDDVDSSNTDSDQKKRRRKHKPPSKWAKIVNATPKLFIYFAATLMAAILFGGLYLILRDKPPSVAGTQQSTLPAVDSGGFMASFMTEETRKNVEATLIAYFAAENWQDRLAFVRDPERVRPLMEEWYNRPENLGTDLPAKISCPQQYQKQEPIGGRIFIMFAVMIEPDNQFQFCSVEQVDPATYKVDWEVTESYQETPLAEFRKSQPQTATPFRAFIKETNYYNGEFIDQNRFRAYSLSNPSDPDFKLWAYVERGTPLESQLDLLLPPLTATSAILELAYPVNPVTDDQVIIKAIAHPNWFY